MKVKKSEDSQVSEEYVERTDNLILAAHAAGYKIRDRGESKDVFFIFYKGRELQIGYDGKYYVYFRKDGKSYSVNFNYVGSGPFKSKRTLQELLVNAVEELIAAL